MSGEIEIIPPGQEIAMDRRSVVIAEALLPPVHQIPSGRWWVLLPGRGESCTMVNDHTLYWPRGVWFVVEDKHFHALMDTDFPMQWLDGWDLHEKTFDTNPRGMRVLGRRRVRSGAGPESDGFITGKRTELLRLR